MLRRAPTQITLTSEDVSAYEDFRRQQSSQNHPSFLNPAATGSGKDGILDPNDELKPLPGDKARVVRSGMTTRFERIGLGR